MKATTLYAALLALVLGVGCGKKEVKQAAKEPLKTKEAPEKSKPKADPTKHERLLWEFETGSNVSYPSIGLDGTVYVASQDKKLYALDGKTGAKIWEFDTSLNDNMLSSPAIGPDGTVYIAGSNIFALDAKTGAKKWERSGAHCTFFAIGAEGTLFFGSLGYGPVVKHRVQALGGKTAGALKYWKLELSGQALGGFVGADGTLYFSSDRKLYALNGKTGVKKREFVISGHVRAIGVDGTLYGAGLGQSIVAWDGVTGAKKWETGTGGGVGAIAIGLNGTVYAGSSDKKLYALDGKTGVKQWEFETGGKVNFPAIGSDGTVYIPLIWDGKLYALNGKTGAKKWEFETGGTTHAPTIGGDGTIYIGAGSKVLALKSDSKGPAKSPWPMYGQNAQHTRRVPAPLPQGKTMAWTASVNQNSIDVFYKGKSYTLVQQHFGKADREQNTWWGYTGLNISDRLGNKYTTVWFGFANGVVQQVRIEK